MELNAREVAADALLEILKGDAYNTMALRRSLRQNGAMQKRDRAFVTESVNGCLRNLYYLDYVIGQFSHIKTTKIKPFLLAVLRISVYQILFLERVPEFAICNEAVTLAKKRGYRELSGFVNGVLRTVLRERENITLPEEGEDPVHYLQIRYSHPEWLLKLWLSEYPYPFVKALAKKNNEAPMVTIAVNGLKITTEALRERLGQGGIRIEKGALFPDALKLAGTPDLQKLPAFQEGLFYVQDESSMLAVDILDPQPGESILDLCAAPGGKSMRMAQKMKNTGFISARDLYMHKVELILENQSRLGVTIIQAEAADATEQRDEDREKFDRVLVDAPCSGFGLLRKKPDIRYRRTGADLDALVPLQRKILDQAAKAVKMGGVLVYSTCTLCRKENIRNIEWFLQTHSFALEDISCYLPETVISDSAEKGYITLFPHIQETDGFFIARMVRKE